MACQICHENDSDCQEHLLTCLELKKRIQVPNDVHYKDIYSKNSGKQLKIVKILKQLLRTREMLLQ